jgi:antitoxin (DNA-binding transcriptional repressor) of toxin-antitoxin stability system
MKKLTVSDAAKKLGSCLDRVYHGHESFELMKNGIPYARLVPVNGTACNSHQFAEDLAEADLSAGERKALATVIREGRKHLKALRNPWA